MEFYDLCFSYSVCGINFVTGWDFTKICKRLLTSPIDLNLNNVLKQIGEYICMKKALLGFSLKLSKLKVKKIAKRTFRKMSLLF